MCMHRHLCRQQYRSSGSSRITRRGNQPKEDLFWTICLTKWKNWDPKGACASGTPWICQCIVVGDNITITSSGYLTLFICLLCILFVIVSDKYLQTRQMRPSWPTSLWMGKHMSTDSVVEFGKLTQLIFLNSVTVPGVPSHAMSLKSPVMLLQNLQAGPRNGLCNGTCLIILKGCFKWKLQVVWTKGNISSCLILLSHQYTVNYITCLIHH